MAKAKRIIQKAAGTASTAWIVRLAKQVKAQLAKEKKQEKNMGSKILETAKELRKARERARAKSRRLK